MAGPLIVTAELAEPDFAWLNGLRCQHFPPERNQLPAHLTMFHAIPPSAEDEVRGILRRLAEYAAPRAWIAGVMNLGGGVALRIASDELDAMRSEIATRLHGLLTAQDSAGWSAHVTIQNKVAPKVARALIEALGETYDRRPVSISGLGLHRYMGGPWETLRTYSFRG
ncbi:2'-5' RNA ligase family protein [Sphingomonas daechungensis]|uniref:2'-5' RNA ligase family protein n=1 Tax=Sphingomonas daechungensis TaxID=1176646 RepID=UPI0031E92D62